MRLQPGHAFRFDRFFPVYNWIYPASVFRSDENIDALAAIAQVSGIRSRALYFHIPFCDTICTFCPFVRGAGHSADTIAHYVDALIAEINVSARALRDVPIAAIFFGGGTPSLLSPQQISRIGRAIRENFDLSRLREFSFEFEVKSATREVMSAVRDIGGTHARFGLQTFVPRYRKLFNLTSTIDDIHRAAADFKTMFPCVSSDLIFGMHGQSVDELLGDLEDWASLGLTNLDLYPINNISIQQKLVDEYRDSALAPTTGELKFYLNQMARSWLAERGYAPHNGHGYVYEGDRAANHQAPITRSYSFCYHEHVYGYDDHDLFGFGVNAISSTRGYRIQNTSSLRNYIGAISEGRRDAAVSRHDPALDAARPIALKLPYGGFVARDLVNWDALPDDTAERFEQVLRAGLVQDTGDEFVLTRSGWDNYTNMMFYLSPASERRALQAMVAGVIRHRGRDIGDLHVPGLALA